MPPQRRGCRARTNLTTFATLIDSPGVNDSGAIDYHQWNLKADMDERRDRERRMTSKEARHDLRQMERRKVFSADVATHSELSKSDLRTILLVGVHLAKVDGEFHWEESRVLQMINDILELTTEERQELLRSGFNLKEGLDALTTSKARELLVKTLCAIAHSDQNIHGAELEFIDKIKNNVGILLEIKPPGMWHEYEVEVAEILRAEMA